MIATMSPAAFLVSPAPTHQLVEGTTCSHFAPQRSKKKFVQFAQTWGQMWYICPHRCQCYVCLRRRHRLSAGILAIWWPMQKLFKMSLWRLPGACWIWLVWENLAAPRGPGLYGKVFAVPGDLGDLSVPGLCGNFRGTSRTCRDLACAGNFRGPWGPGGIWLVEKIVAGSGDLLGPGLWRKFLRSLRTGGRGTETLVFQGRGDQRGRGGVTSKKLHKLLILF